MSQQEKDHHDIIELLSSFRPVPSDKLRHRFLDELHRMSTQTETNRHWNIRRSGLKLRYAGIASVALGFLITAMFVFAQSGDSEFFRRSETDEFDSRYVRRIDPEQYQEAGDVEDLGEFSLSIAETEAISGIDLRLPPLLPDDYRIERGSAIPGLAVVNIATGRKLPHPNNFFLTAWDTSTDVIPSIWHDNQIGNSAIVEVTNVGDIRIEYVEGGWRTIGGRLTWQMSGQGRAIWEDQGIRYLLRAFDSRVSARELAEIARCTYIPFPIYRPHPVLDGLWRELVSKDIDCDVERGIVQQVYTFKKHGTLAVLQYHENQSPAGLVVNHVEDQFVEDLGTVQTVEGTWLGEPVTGIQITTEENQLIAILAITADPQKTLTIDSIIQIAS